MNPSGFTIVELLIATSVFSIILLVALAGFLQIGHIFYKGVSLAQTQEIATHIFQDIDGNFQTAANVSPPQTDSASGYSYFCIGNARYTYNLGYEIGLSATPNHSAPNHPYNGSGGNFGVLKDVLPGSSACATPCTDTVPLGACTPPSLRLNNPTELLGEKMRLSNISITNPNTQNPNIYNVNIVVAYGDDDLMDLTNPTAPVCKITKGGEFCAVSQINTAVFRGLH